MTKKRTEYVKVIEDEPFEHSTKGDLWIQCCDCGLVHKWQIKVLGPNKVQVFVKRHDRATAGVRRHRAAGLQKGSDADWMLVKIGKK